MAADNPERVMKPPRMRQILCLNRDCRETLLVLVEPDINEEWTECPECGLEYNSTCAPTIKWLRRSDG
jgi:hypothetical protein